MELWDIYDSDKKRTGRTMKKEDWCLKEGEYHLSVLGAVRRLDGKYLITRRSQDKSWAPGWWEISGGAVQAGEDSKEAVIREIYEETGLDVSHADGGFIFSYHRKNIKEGDNYFVDVYRFDLDFDEKDIFIQKEEVLDFMIVDAVKIKEIADEKIFLHYDSIKEIFI